MSILLRSVRDHQVGVLNPADSPESSCYTVPRRKVESFEKGEKLKNENATVIKIFL
jgi:hypothetical protein